MYPTLTWKAGISACTHLSSRLGEKLPDERRRYKPKLLVARQGLHPHPGPGSGMYDFDDPEGPDWEEEVEEVSCDDARTQPEMPDVRNDTSPELLRILVDNGCPLVGPSMKTNPNSSVWRDPDDSADHCYARRNGVCRGEAEEVLGKQWSLWDPVAWAINTSSGQEYVDPSTTEKNVGTVAPLRRMRRTSLI